MNKTKDGRYLETRIRIPKNLLSKLIWGIKKDKKYTWRQLAEELGVAEQTVRVDWFCKNRTLPLSKFRMLVSMSKKFSYNNFKDKKEFLDPFWGQRITTTRNFKQGIKFPKIDSKEFAEFYGIMLGDGCIYANMNCFCITGNKILENEYYNIYLKNLIKHLFGVFPAFTIAKEAKVIRCYLYSKKVTQFLTNLGFPAGKKQNTCIPKFLNNKLLLAHCIRGFFDTDGSLSNHPGAKIMIHLSIPQDKLRLSILESLKLFDIKISKSSNALFIYGKENVAKFMDLIGTSNRKNQYKYKQFNKTGKVPTSKETESFLINNL